MLIGYMHHRREPFGLNRAYAFAAVAKAEGAEALYFSPGAIADGVINGYVYNGGKWVKRASRYPDVVYNTTGFSKESQLEAVDKLQREKIPFTSHSIGDKMTVYNNLKRYGKFSGYLVPSETVVSERHFFSLLNKYPDMVLKPSSGRQGVNVRRVRKGGVPDDLPRLLAGEKYIVQPYINCRTKSGEPYDFRLHAQKGRGGAWAVPCVYPRISPDGGIVCNISRGGYTRDLTDFLKAEFGEEHYSMKKYLEVFALQLAEHLDQIQKELYGEELDELGIDAGIDKQLYIYEVNWRPGHPPFGSADLSVIRNTVHYAMFLAEKRGVPA